MCNDSVSQVYTRVAVVMVEVVLVGQGLCFAGIYIAPNLQHILEGVLTWAREY